MRLNSLRQTTGWISLLALGLPLLMLMSLAARAQFLTPGANAIGGLGEALPLIGAAGQPVPVGSAPSGAAVGETPQGGQVAGVTTGTSLTTGATVHLPDPNWPLILPEPRGLRGRGGQTSASSAATQGQTGDAETTSTSQTTTPNSPGAESVVATPEPQSPEPSNNATTTVTASATTENAPGAESDTVNVLDETSLSPLDTFERAALNFGAFGVDLTAQHEIALDPVVALMRASPGEPLRVVAVLPLAEANNDDSKTLARRRILTVRSYLIERGLNADNLSFVISANTATEPLAHHVLIERANP